MSMPLLAGVGRANITPPVGVDLMGTSRRWGPAIGIHRDLYATCLVLSTGNQSLALVSCDLLSIPEPTAGELRQRIGQIIGAGANQVLLACTHTHSAPVTSPHMPKIGGDQTGLREVEQAYVAHLGYQLESAARLAVANLTPARLAAGTGQIDIVVNRREQLEDGQVIIGRNFNRPRDPEVGILRVDTEAGASLAAVVNFACHPVAISPECRLISPDIIGAVREVVEDLTGATVLYFTGAAGDIMLLRTLHHDPSLAENLGAQIGCEATRVFLGLNPKPTELYEKFMQSVSTLKVFEEVPVERPPITYFRVASRQLELEFQPLPSLAEAEQILRASQERVQQLQTNDASMEVLNPAIYQALWASRLVEGLRAGTVSQTLGAEIQAIRLDDIAIVSVPGEPFAEMGLRVKAGSPFKHTFFVGYANGTIGYIPMREDYPLGGYEVMDAFKGYGFPAALAPGTAELIVEACLDLLHELANAETMEDI